MTKTDHREFLNTSPKGSGTDDIDFSTMKLGIKDKMGKHNSVGSKGKSKGKLVSVKCSLTQKHTANSGRAETARIWVS